MIGSMYRNLSLLLLTLSPLCLIEGVRAYPTKIVNLEIWSDAFVTLFTTNSKEQMKHRLELMRQMVLSIDTTPPYDIMMKEVYFKMNKLLLRHFDMDTKLCRQNHFLIETLQWVHRLEVIGCTAPEITKLKKIQNFFLNIDGNLERHRIIWNRYDHLVKFVGFRDYYEKCFVKYHEHLMNVLSTLSRNSINRSFSIIKASGLIDNVQELRTYSATKRYNFDKRTSITRSAYEHLIEILEQNYLMDNSRTTKHSKGYVKRMIETYTSMIGSTCDQIDIAFNPLLGPLEVFMISLDIQDRLDQGIKEIIPLLRYCNLVQTSQFASEVRTEANDAKEAIDRTRALYMLS